MRTLVVSTALLLLAAAAHAEDDSVLIGHARLWLGMSEAEVSAAAGKELTLQKAADQVPPRSAYRETHGTHVALLDPSKPREPKAWLTYEEGKLTRVTRFLGQFDKEGVDNLVKDMATALDSLGASTDVHPTVRTRSWSDGHSEFRSIEFSSGQKQVLVGIRPDGVVYLDENLGRGDIPDTWVGN